MGDLETVVRGMIAAYEKLDGDAILSMSGSDIQAVDEISRKWMRGTAALKEYFNALPGELSDVSTALSDFSETVYGDTGVVTFWIEQDYSFDGEEQHISAPTTAVFHKEGGTWRAVLFHSIPLPAESN